MHCKDCIYAEKDRTYTDMYSCKKIIDSNNVQFSYNKKTQEADTTIAYSWDCESYSSGNYVGKDFGCIHFKTKDTHD